ncbi:11462_t:CDS:10 [Entrophospora sp. SA101]|nr:11669_t:CDS:10 [Entrophospora sp. SA101]CAJ0903805.1 11462_t:CDS:10 [Entrophospora sp. SA101]
MSSINSEQTHDTQSENSFAEEFIEDNNGSKFSKSSRTLESKSVSPKNALAYSILCDLLDECTLDILLETHREAKLAASVCQLCNTECRSFVSQPGLDIFGNNPQPNNSPPTFECVSCRRTFPSKRYAPHLEKCMGLAGRSSSRVANLRLGTDRNPSSPYTPPILSEDNPEPSDSDGGLYVENKMSDSTNETPNLIGTNVSKLKMAAAQRKNSVRSDSPTPSSTSNSPLRSSSPLKRVTTLPSSNTINGSIIIS